MEVSELADATDKGGMGIPDADSLSSLRRRRGNHITIMEGGQYFSRRDAEVSYESECSAGANSAAIFESAATPSNKHSQILLLGTLETADEDDAK